jgi:general secretion pathway protein D
MIAWVRRSTQRIALAALILRALPWSLEAYAAHEPARTGYNLAFVDADAHHVVDAVLGDVLHLNFSVDPKVTGTVTLRTASPVDRDGAIALLEKALEPIGAVIIENGGSYRVLPKESARAAALMGAASSDGPTTGYSSEAVKLRYANPAQIAHLIEEFVGKDVVAGIDPAYNQILLAGSSDERSAALSIIRRFDIDTLSGSTFQLIKLENVDADALQAELKAIFQPPLDIIGSRVRIVPLPRLHSVLAIAADASDIARIQPWIERLDAGGASTKRKLYSYAVQNGRARDLAASLQMVLGGGGGGLPDPTIAQPQDTSTPLLDTSSAVGSLGGGLSGFGSLGGGGGSTGGGSSIANQTLDPAQIGAETSLSGGSSARVSATPVQAAGGNGARIVPVDTTNTLLIYANGEEHDFVMEALAALDKPVPQIMIEATLAEVTLTKDLQYGVNWQVMSGNSSFTLSNTAGAAPAASFPGFSYAYIGKSVQAVLNTLQSKSNVRVLSAPKLMVLNNQTATLQVGDEVPVVTQQSQSTVASNAPLVNTVELRDTGVILKVTPRVNDNGMITLDIAQEVSEVAKTTTSGIDSPTISQRRLTSTVTTRSGEMVALGGLIRENVSRSRQGIPGLSQIPVVGALFGQHTTSGDRTELIILMTPLVMRSPEEAHAALDELLGRMQAVKPVLDDAIDRTPPRAPKH